VWSSLAIAGSGFQCHPTQWVISSTTLNPVSGLTSIAILAYSAVMVIPVLSMMIGVFLNPIMRDGLHPKNVQPLLRLVIASLITFLSSRTLTVPQFSLSLISTFSGDHRSVRNV
jgi:hypothetical protein